MKKTSLSKFALLVAAMTVIVCAPAIGQRLSVPSSTTAREEPAADQVIVFVVEPGSIRGKRIRVIPVNHDVLESVARQYGLTPINYRPAVSKIETGSLARIAVIHRFNDPLKRPKQFANIDVVVGEGEPDRKMKIWQTPDTKREARMIRSLAAKHDNRILVLDSVLVNQGLLEHAVKHAHWKKVPTKYDPYWAHPGDEAPDLSGFGRSDTQACCH